MRVLILRPEPGNAATCKAVEALGCTAIGLPLFEVTPVACEPPDPADFDAVVMTSANAARHGGKQLTLFTHLPVFAVGEQTAEAARAAGFPTVTAGPADAAALSDMLPARVLHLAGADFTPLPTAARVTTVVVYAARPIAVDCLPDADVAFVHSPRAGTALDALAGTARTMKLITISPAAVTACGTGWPEIHVADAPREAAMLETLASLCKAQRA